MTRLPFRSYREYAVVFWMVIGYVLVRTSPSYFLHRRRTGTGELPTSEDPAPSICTFAG